VAQYGCYVYGIDLSVNMILAALESAAAGGNGDLVSFEVSDATRRDLPPASFDAVHSRDALVHVADKPALFARLADLLRPGGRLLITDYCRAEGDPSPGFRAYAAQRGYDLQTVPDYAALLAAAGFEDVRCEDRSAQLTACLEAELAAVEAGREAFVAALGEAEHARVVAGWRAKLERCRAGEHRCGLFRATKPL
jgi:phosphoethanolamine N-methyltransferase